MFKHISMTYTKQPNGTYCVQITSQTHRNSKFGNRGSHFIASCGVRLSSLSHPALLLTPIPSSATELTLYVRGSTCRQDNQRVLIPNRVILDKLQLALCEYNAKEIDCTR